MSGCIEWQGSRTRGYGHRKVAGKMRYTHRIAYVEAHNLTLDDIEGLKVLHKCDNPPCMNPDHLFLGTQADNVADMISKGRRNVGVGGEHPSAKFTDAEIARVLELRREGMLQRQIAAVTGISRSHISNVLVGKFRNKQRAGKQ